MRSIADEAKDDRDPEDRDTLEQLLAYKPQPPKWLSPKKVKNHHATAVIMLSDLHLDEVVDPDEVFGVNAYNREIALIRLRATFDKAIDLCRDYLSGVIYDGCVVNFGGDVFTGILHDLPQFNDGKGNLESVTYWLDPLAAGIGQLADFFGKVFVPVVPGNHGRLSLKPRTKGRAEDNIDWLIGWMLKEHFKGDDRITFELTKGTDVQYRVYDTTFQLTHGDQATGGSGIGGIWPPIMRLNAKKSMKMAGFGQPYDVLLMGHWHQLRFGGEFVVNGSLVGLSEYSNIGNFPHEPPKQALFTVTPENGVSFQVPILPQNPKREGWG